MNSYISLFSSFTDIICIMFNSDINLYTTWVVLMGGWPGCLYLQSWSSVMADEPNNGYHLIQWLEVKFSADA